MLFEYHDTIAKSDHYYVTQWNEYHSKSKDTINADPADILSAFSEIETNLMQSITNLKDETINLKDIIIKNHQDEIKCFKTKANIMENKVIDLEFQNNNVDLYIVAERTLKFQEFFNQ